MITATEKLTFGTGFEKLCPVACCVLPGTNSPIKSIYCRLFAKIWASLYMQNEESSGLNSSTTNRKENPTNACIRECGSSSNLVGCRLLDWTKQSIHRRQQTVKLSERSGTSHHWQICSPTQPTTPPPQYLYRQQEGMPAVRLRSYIPLGGTPIQTY